METFCEAREFVQDTRYDEERGKALTALGTASIDEPIADIIAGFATLPHCFTLQCCFGHFVCSPEQDAHTLEPLPVGYSGRVRYRIAYLAFCIENSPRGTALRQSLSRIPEIAPGYLQFGSADWFWQNRVNTYALQVMPAAHQYRDEAMLEAIEAFRTLEVRERFFEEIRRLVAAEISREASGPGTDAEQAAAQDGPAQPGTVHE